MSDLYNHLPEDFDFFTGEPLSEEVWRRKYRHTAEDNFADTSRRVVNGVYVNDSTTEQQLAYDAIRLGLWMPGGRILAGAGTNKRVTLFNCFDELELLMTRDGIMDFHDAQGPTEVLTQKGWIEADIRRFGIQKVHKYTFVPCTKDNRGGRSQYRREVLATPDHRWILTSGKETTALDVGMRVPACAYTGEVNEAQYRNGFKHGIVFGDGTHTRTTLRQVGNGYPLGTMHFAVRLCGAKADYLPWFEGENITYPPSSKGDPHVFLHTMEDLKAVPTTEKSPDYIKGFIDGWAAMDGGSSVAGEHSKAIFSKNRAALDWLCAHAPFAGYIPVGNRRFSSGETNYGGKGELWVVTIREVAYVEWECVGIAEYGDRPVMCAVVPEEAAFTLVGGIYTGNCYVNETIEDSMEGIHRGFGNVMFTMQQGGGIGTDFTPIRPNGAWLSRTQAPASGPIPFAIAQDAIGQTVESAGERRGAQMGTLADFHPDLPAFISAKHTAGVLTQFNLSILVSDAFMSAVAEDEDWLLYHAVKPFKRDPALEALDFYDEVVGCQAYVYAKWRARELWELITRSTYEYSEPGIIFIDRVNDLNNLYYREQIRCTNPCGEQPLPPKACCNLGANNLAIMVRNPYTDDAEFDFALLGRVARIGQRFLDNVTDVTNYPLEAQRKEQMLTRRTGNGQSGLASAMAQLGIRYGSAKAARFASEVSKTIAFAAYEASADLAEERGAFPAYDEASFWNPSANSFAVQRFKGTPLFGRPLRNGVMLTCAPNGTTSVAYGNIDSGIEPIFALEYDRRVRQPDNSYKVSKVKSFSLRLWEHLNPGEPLPKHVNTTEDLQIHEHVLVQEAIQYWTDASISKTINIPESMPYEEFAKVYDLAYESGLKGCTTYRPSAVRGSILSTGTTAESSGAAATPAAAKTPLPDDIKRPDILQATIAKIRWPQMSSAAYVHLGRMEDGTPFEVFLTSKDQRNMEWMTTATLMASWLLRLGVPLKTIAEELQKIESMDGALVKGRYRPSFVSLVGHTLLEMDKANRGESSPVEEVYTIHAAPSDETRVVAGASVRCPVCRSPNVTMRNGCISCPDCGESKCG